MTQHHANSRRRFSERDHVATRAQPVQPDQPPMYRCTVCGSLGFGRVRPDSLFGYCLTCGLHRTFTVATDPDARRWQRIRAGMAAPRQDGAMRDSDIDVLSSEALQ